MRLKLFMAAAMLSAGIAARAASITETFSETVTGTTSTGLAIAQFDPALGTLTSVSGTLTGSLMYDNPNYLNLVIYVNDLGSNTLVEEASRPNGGITFSVSGSLTDSGDLNADTGGGLAPFTFNVNTGGGTTLTGVVSGTITYDYTPSVVVTTATPEPSSFLLLGTGLLGLAGFVKRRIV